MGKLSFGELKCENKNSKYGGPGHQKDEYQGKNAGGKGTWDKGVSSKKGKGGKGIKKI